MLALLNTSSLVKSKHERSQKNYRIVLILAASCSFSICIFIILKNAFIRIAWVMKPNPKDITRKQIT